jgi:hypothetical protein
MNERVIEIPWALAQLPQSGSVLDVGSCDATYLNIIPQPDRVLHCLDSRACSESMPPGVVFHQENLIGNGLPRGYFDAILCISTLEHIGLACYGQKPFRWGDRLALAEMKALLKRDGYAIVTVPVGQSKITTWYRQYSPSDLEALFCDWEVQMSFWGFDGAGYQPIPEAEVTGYDYRDRSDEQAGAGAVVGIIARPR